MQAGGRLGIPRHHLKEFRKARKQLIERYRSSPDPTESHMQTFSPLKPMLALQAA